MKLCEFEYKLKTLDGVVHHVGLVEHEIESIDTKQSCDECERVHKNQTFVSKLQGKNQKNFEKALH